MAQSLKDIPSNAWKSIKEIVGIKPKPVYIAPDKSTYSIPTTPKPPTSGSLSSKPNPFKPSPPSRSGGSGGVGNGGTSQLGTPTQSYDIVKDTSVTTVKSQVQSQQFSGMTQQEIQQQLAIQRQQKYISDNIPQSFKDTGTGIKNIYTGIKEKVINSIKPVVKSISESSTAQIFSKGGEKVSGALNIIENKVRNVLQPKTIQEEQLVRETTSTIKEAEDYSKSMDERNKLVENLNNKYMEITTQEQLDNYNRDKSKIENIDKQLTNTQSYLSSREAYLKSKEKGLRIQRENSPLQFVTSILTGIVTFPTTTAKLGIGLITKPVTTIKETVTGFKELPKQFVEKPVSTSGEIIGQIIGGVLVGQVIKIARGGTAEANVGELRRIEIAKNKALGLSDKFKSETITITEEASIRNKLLSSKSFSEDSNIQNIIRESTIGKLIRRTSSGRETVRYIVKGNLAGKDYILTFGERAGKIISPKVAIADNKTISIYRPAYSSEVSKPTKINIQGQPPIEISKIEQFKKLGTYARTGKVISYKELIVGEKTLKISNSESKLYQIGKGSTKTESLSDILQIEKQPKVIKLLKQPKQISEAKAVKIEVTKTKEITMENLEAVKKNSIAYEKSISKLTPPIFEFDIKNIVKNINKRKLPIKFEEGIKPKEVNVVNNSKIWNKYYENVASSNENNILKQPIQLKKPISFPSELAFSPRRIKTNIPKVSTRFADYTKTSKEFGELGIAESRFGKGEVKFDFNKLQDNINKNNKRYADLISVKPDIRIKKGEGTITDTFNKLFPKIRNNIDNKDLQKNLQNLSIAQKQNQQQKQLQKQINKLEQPQVNINKYPRTPKVSEIIFKPFIFPTQKKQEQDYKKLYGKLIKKQSKFEGKYTASLGSAFFQEKPLNISRKEYNRLSRKVYSGYESRPVLNIIEDKEMNKQIKRAVQF